MKVLFTTYPTAFQFKGGGELILEKIQDRLQKKGVEVKLFDMWKDKIADFDVVHNFGVFSDTASIVDFAKAYKVPVAVHTIYWPQAEAALKGDLPFRQRLKKLAYNYTNKYNLLGISKMRRIVDTADLLCPNSEIEAQMLMKEFKCKREKIHVIPDGVEHHFYKPSPDEFVQKYGLKDFVLVVGRIEPRRNPLGVIRALKGSGLPVVVIGDHDQLRKDYYDLCRKEADENVHFLGRFEHNSSLFASAYAAAKVFVAATWAETPGLAAMEAGMAGANIVITTRGCAREYFLDYVDYIDPTNLKQLRETIIAAYNKPRRYELAEHLKNNYSWEKVADITIAGYEKIIRR